MHLLFSRTDNSTSTYSGCSSGSGDKSSSSADGADINCDQVCKNIYFLHNFVAQKAEVNKVLVNKYYIAPII